MPKATITMFRHEVKDALNLAYRPNETYGPEDGSISGIQARALQMLTHALPVSKISKVTVQPVPANPGAGVRAAFVFTIDSTAALNPADARQTLAR